MLLMTEKYRVYYFERNPMEIYGLKSKNYTNLTRNIMYKMRDFFQKMETLALCIAVLNIFGQILKCQQYNFDF